MNALPVLDVVIVGAGPAGLGCAHALRQCGVEKLFVIDREEIGQALSAGLPR
ncbi:MAG: NAD(P)-binding domain-containing protein [Roseimicrobium sp.]